MDSVLIVAGFWLAYILRYRHAIGGAVAQADFHTFREFAPLTFALGAILIGIFAVRGSYRLTQRRPGHELWLIGSSTLLGFAILIALVGSAQAPFFSRLLLVYAFVLDGALLTANALARSWLHAWTLTHLRQVARAADLSLTYAIVLIGALPMLLVLTQQQFTSVAATLQQWRRPR